MAGDPKLTFELVREAVAGSAAAFRLALKLDAVSPKVFPPTYEGGKYATEERRIKDEKGNIQTVPCVLLDSVPSQANRMELTLQEAWESGDIELPVIVVDFTAAGNPGVRKITSFQAPHRIADAILRDSLLGRQKFRQSEIGKALGEVGPGYATPLLRYAPHSLVFGMWDSTGPRGGLGVKFARAIISEIIGVNAVPGLRTSSRIDPLNIRANAGPIYRAKDGGWTTEEGKAQKQGNKYVLFKNKEDGDSKKEGKPAAIIHGNIKPVISEGGFTIDYAEQTTVLSLPALRRLRFPVKPGDKSTPGGDAIARTYLAALGLLGATLAVEAGYDLRSRCLLRAAAPVRWQLLGRPGEPDRTFDLSRDGAIELYNQALAAVRGAKLPIETDEIVLTPSDNLVKLVKESIKLAAAETGGGD
ncbi:MAG TPA: type I-U CRISPR-associated RAMP protein Csb1/Cas7u [Gemmataceae bacterium]|nr:type I-U CRISPR-associated RAMP protein Csb1/Cas7u [Gemmataceae bacterium]